jgi:hypothetical protein
MAMEKETLVYSFWNGKNLRGKPEAPDMDADDCANCAFRCVEGTETVSGDDLSW